ncbi:MAG: DMT family transporter [Coxiellaceae bacterium]|jgi:S-adenosylmethionine uptake transporter|nr:DMT family transporter [Coxiellaceae bacterium]
MSKCFTDIGILKWINSPGHFQGIFWTICASFFSNLCDTSIKLVSNDIPPMQITFFRLFFGTLILLPILLSKGKNTFYIKNKRDHFIRIVIGFGAITCWVFGASQTSLPSITTISFACPLFVLPLAYIFLGEKSDWRRMLSVGAGFLGVIIIAFCENNGRSDVSGTFSLHSGVLLLLCAAILFAFSDIMNKKMISSESLISLLFYFYSGTALVASIPALLVWHSVGYLDLFCLLFLGTGGVSVLFCILKVAAATEISSIAPYKYLELIISIVVGYLLFNEIIKVSTIIGACLIVPSAFLIAYHEISKEKKLKSV